MIEFNKIYIEGFCSITSLEMPLNTQKITIVRGPNGYGKSNFLSAIVWALYGKNLKKDATHFIRADIASQAYFSRFVKNGEEWIYF